MSDIEPQLNSEENTLMLPTSYGQLLAMVDALQTGTLNDTQREVEVRFSGTVSVVSGLGEAVPRHLHRTNL